MENPMIPQFDYQPTDEELADMLLQMQCGLWSSEEELEALGDKLEQELDILPDRLRGPVPDSAYARVKEILSRADLDDCS